MSLFNSIAKKVKKRTRLNLNERVFIVQWKKNRRLLTVCSKQLTYLQTNYKSYKSITKYKYNIVKDNQNNQHICYHKLRTWNISLTTYSITHFFYLKQSTILILLSSGHLERVRNYDNYLRLLKDYGHQHWSNLEVWMIEWLLCYFVRVTMMMCCCFSGGRGRRKRQYVGTGHTNLSTKLTPLPGATYRPSGARENWPISSTGETASKQWNIWL